MSKSNAPVKNAEEIIERFGGIRPMATKTDIPVTTIQGWKKRDAIPAKRMDEIVKAARDNGVDITDLIASGGANENVHVKPAAPVSKVSVQDTKKEAALSDVIEKQDEFEGDDEGEDIILDQRVEDSNSPAAPERITAEAVMIEEKLAQMESRAVTKSVMISVGAIILIAVLLTAFLIWPSAKDIKEQVSQNEAEIAAIQGDESGGISAKMTDFLPKSWKDQLDNVTTQAQEMKTQAAELKAQADAALVKAEEISSDVLGKDAGNFEQRLSKLEGHYNEAMETPQMTYFMEQIKGMGASVPGQETLESAQSQLSNLMSAYTGTPDQLDTYLNKAREQSAVLGQTFENVPADDIKAASLLFTLNQLRSALNRDNQPYGEDLELFTNFLGIQDPELNEALTKLTPSAEQGVLTLNGLSTEFRTLAGDVVEASLKGEDVSLQEKTKARMNDLFSVQKDGELVTGTETQASVQQIDKMLLEGKLDEALSEAETLDGEEAQAIAPWISKAEQTKAAQELTRVLDHNIDMRTMETQKTGGAVSAAAAPIEAGRMVVDPKSGLRIFIPAENMVINNGTGSISE